VAQEQTDFQAVQCEIDGGTSCPAGSGANADEKEQKYSQDQIVVEDIRTQLESQQSQLSSSDTAAERTRYQLAVNELPAAEQKLNAAVAALDKIAGGPPVTLQALRRLAGNASALTSAALLFMVFLALSCQYVLSRLLRRREV
jgi:predicted  nucleic acid-binding Zn-ribbon protein